MLVDIGELKIKDVAWMLLIFSSGYYIRFSSTNWRAAEANVEPLMENYVKRATDGWAVDHGKG